MNDVPFIGARMEKKKAERKWVISFSQVACKERAASKFKVFKFGQLKMLLLEV